MQMELATKQKATINSASIPVCLLTVLLASARSGGSARDASLVCWINLASLSGTGLAFGDDGHNNKSKSSAAASATKPPSGRASGWQVWNYRNT
jgi:hypothetical protein